MLKILSALDVESNGIICINTRIVIIEKHCKGADTSRPLQLVTEVVHLKLCSVSKFS